VSKYLYDKTMADGTNSNNFQAMINHAVKYLLEQTEAKTQERHEQRRRYYTRSMCDAAATTPQWHVRPLVAFLRPRCGTRDEQPWPQDDPAKVRKLCPSGLPSRALAAGAFFGLFSLVQRLVREGTDDVYAETSFGTPLQCAAKQGNCGVMELLLEQPLADANVGIPSMTRLVIAAYAGHENIVRMLIRPQYGWPESEVLYEAIHNAARGGHTRVLNILKEVKGSDPVKLPEQGILIEVALYGHEYVGQMALDNGPDVNRESYELRKGPALKRAAEGGHEGIVRLLLSEEAHQKVKSGGPLAVAVRWGLKSIVQVLLEDGAHDFSDSRFISEAGTGHSALHAAASMGRPIWPASFSMTVWT